MIDKTPGVRPIIYLFQRLYHDLFDIFALVLQNLKQQAL